MSNVSMMRPGNCIIGPLSFVQDKGLHQLCWGGGLLEQMAFQLRVTLEKAACDSWRNGGSARINCGTETSTLE